MQLLANYYKDDDEKIGEFFLEAVKKSTKHPYLLHMVRFS